MARQVEVAAFEFAVDHRVAVARGPGVEHALHRVVFLRSCMLMDVHAPGEDRSPRPASGLLQMAREGALRLTLWAGFWPPSADTLAGGTPGVLPNDPNDLFELLDAYTSFLVWIAPRTFLRIALLVRYCERVPTLLSSPNIKDEYSEMKQAKKRTRASSTREK